MLVPDEDKNFDASKSLILDSSEKVMMSRKKRICSIYYKGFQGPKLSPRQSVLNVNNSRLSSHLVWSLKTNERMAEWNG